MRMVPLVVHVSISLLMCMQRLIYIIYCKYLAPDDGSVGDLYTIKSSEELNNYISKPPSDSGKAVVLPGYLFNKYAISIEYYPLH